MEKRTVSLLLAMILTVTLCACGKPSGGSWEEQYDLGVRYLSDGNYEEAIIAFTAAIEINPKRNEAYIALADVYIYQSEYAKAIELLKDALGKTDDVEIMNKLADVENIAFENGYCDFLLTDQMFRIDEWLVGEKTISQCTIDDFMTVYPSKSGYSNFDGYEEYSPPANEGSLRVENNPNTGFSAHFYYDFRYGIDAAKEGVSQANIGGIRIGDSMEDVLEKLGFSETGVTFLAMKIEQLRQYDSIGLQGIYRTWLSETECQVSGSVDIVSFDGGDAFAISISDTDTVCFYFNKSEKLCQISYYRR